jgi:hypothetical protein
MITKNISWSLGPTPNKSLETSPQAAAVGAHIEPSIPIHLPGDPAITQPTEDPRPGSNPPMRRPFRVIRGSTSANLCSNLPGSSVPGNNIRRGVGIWLLVIGAPRLSFFLHKYLISSLFSPGL